MTPFYQVQKLARDTIAGADYFADSAANEVLLDDGKVSKEKEAALSSVGQCVRVPWLLGGTMQDHGKNAVSVDIGLAVIIESNPLKMGRNVYEMIKAVISALLSWAPQVHPNEKFRLSEKGFVLVLDDPGLVRYHVFFQKLCTF